MSDVLRSVADVECNSGSTIRLGLPAFINHSISAVFVVDPKALLQNWQAHPASSKHLVQEADGLPAVPSELRKYRTLRQLEHSVDYPIEMPQVFINPDYDDERSHKIGMHPDSSDILSTMARLGATAVPVCVVTAFTDDMFKIDFRRTQKALGAKLPGQPASLLEERSTEESAGLLKFLSQEFTSALPLRDLAPLVDAYARNLPKVRYEYHQACAKADPLRPNDFEAFEAEAHEIRDKDIAANEMGELSEVLYLFAPIRYNADDVKEYRRLQSQQLITEEPFRLYDGFDACRDLVDILICAGVHGATIPSQYDGFSMLSALTPLAEQATRQINHPIGSPIELVDRFDSTVQRLQRRLSEYAEGETSLQSVASLQTMLAPLGKAILSSDVAQSLANRELDASAKSALSWLAHNQDANALQPKELLPIPVPRQPLWMKNEM